VSMTQAALVSPVHIRFPISGYTKRLEDGEYKPEQSVHLSWVRLDPALERIQRTIVEYERTVEQTEYCCYADMVSALKLIYEQERTVRRAYG
jgi:hypothetical protein